MAAILNLAILNAMLQQKKTLSFILTQFDDGSHLEFANLNSTILDSAILVFPLKLTHTCQDWFPPFAQKNFNLFWLNLMMAAILNSAMLNLDTWHLGFRHLDIFSQILLTPLWLWIQSASNHSCYLLSDQLCTKYFTDSICLKFINLMMAILNSAMLNSDTAILDSDRCYLLSDSLKNTLTPLWLWLKLIQSDSNST